MYKLLRKGYNNEAEYEALIARVKFLIEFKAKNVLIRGGSSLVISQLKKNNKCESSNLCKIL